MGRHKSPISVKRRSKGFDYQPRDVERLRFITRWYCVSPMHLLRREEDADLWHPVAPGFDLDDEDRQKRLTQRLNNLRRRMMLMRRIQPYPPVGSERASATSIGYYATQSGGTMVSPWSNIRPASFQNIAHAFMATDIGMHLERAGFRVYSEREVATGNSVTGVVIQHPLTSKFNTSDGGREIIKTPDLAIASRATKNFIAVEIERDENRPLKVYKDKLIAYQANPHVQKVWYCYREGTNTGPRVREAAMQLWGEQYEHLVRLVPCALRRGKPLNPEWDDTDPLRQEDFYELGSSDPDQNTKILGDVFTDLEALR